MLIHVFAESLGTRLLNSYWLWNTTPMWCHWVGRSQSVCSTGLTTCVPHSLHCGCPVGGKELISVQHWVNPLCLTFSALRVSSGWEGVNLCVAVLTPCVPHSLHCGCPAFPEVPRVTEVPSEGSRLAVSGETARAAIVAGLQSAMTVRRLQTSDRASVSLVFNGGWSLGGDEADVSCAWALTTTRRIAR